MKCCGLSIGIKDGIYVSILHKFIVKKLECQNPKRTVNKIGRDQTGKRETRFCITLLLYAGFKVMLEIIRHYIVYGLSWYTKLQL